jgi:F0F1-type ATP synthase membrane subunit a
MGVTVSLAMAGNALFALELLIAYLQAYIFTFISCITIKDMAIDNRHYGWIWYCYY